MLGEDGADGDMGPPGFPATPMFSGLTTINFGSVPGQDSVTITVSRTSVTSTTQVFALLWPAATSNKSRDEHLMESVVVYAHDITAGVGFQITASSTAGLLLGVFSVMWMSTQ
jgi:hypothetical protein